MDQPSPVAKLIDAICENFMNALPGKPWAPVYDGDTLVRTFCDFFVSGVVKLGFEYTGFINPLTGEAYLADKMVDIMQSSDEWMKEVSGNMAQFHANQGALVVAGWINPDGHGHVCIVRPGIEVFSGHWNKNAPRVANVGKDVFINEDAAYAFIDEPSYFVLKRSIS